MSKTLLRMLTIGLFIFLALGQLANRPQAFRANGENPAANPQGHKTTVEVTFDGLMVFQKVKDYDRYEVGIVDRADHEFKIIVGKHEINLKSAARFIKTKKELARMMTSISPLTLEVRSGSGMGSPKSADIWARDKKSCGRQQDTVAHENVEHAFDFCWIMDLEREFHGGRPLDLIPGKLKPIILLRHGELYTRFKYDQLEREESPDSKTWKPLGFVAETITLRVDLKQGEFLVLRNDNGAEAFRLPTAEGELDAAILNSPVKQYHRLMRKGGRDHSHFLYYYDLFSNVAPEEKVDIEPVTNGFSPINRFIHTDSLADQMRWIYTFDNQECGSAFLGLRTQPLK